MKLKIRYRHKYASIVVMIILPIMGIVHYIASRNLGSLLVCLFSAIYFLLYTVDLIKKHTEDEENKTKEVNK